MRVSSTLPWSPEPLEHGDRLGEVPAGAAVVAVGRRETSGESFGERFCRGRARFRGMRAHLADELGSVRSRIAHARSLSAS